MKKRILTISDEGGQHYVENARAAWAQRDFILVDKPISAALLENNLEDYHMIALTLNQSSNSKFHRYVKLLRSLSNTPIVLFPYEDNANKSAEAVVHENDIQMIALPVNMIWAIEKCIEIVNTYADEKEKQKKPLTLYVDYKITLDSGTCCAVVDDLKIELSVVEFDILSLLMEYRGIYLSHSQIYRHVWGSEYSDAPANLIHNHMKNIRKKIQWNDSLPKYIWTKRGKGYVFSPQYTKDKSA
ncbi:winged helix-turn-helix domain-containing protein [Ruminococcaceae bacterium OttesenSCG-928-D13]|nr:winged helix-turn-helix domain-containing protein [Ruminococcaceae bacterium OttesenSCG-928-D13]